MTTFGSVCSGIEAASVAWHPLGWHASWLAEIEPFPSAVLAHHYPEVPNLGDMTKLPKRIAAGEVDAPDVFCGGTPCQAFSVAGLRKSLDDARGNLSLVFCEIANAIDTARATKGKPPAVVFWENVPGVLNTKDNAFGCFLGALAGEDDPLVAPGGKWTDAGCVYGPQRAVAWRILDAQYFGLAQRRRRVFVVASARNGFDPAAVLFEFDGVRRDTAPSREAGQTITPAVTAGAPNGGAAHGARSGSAKEGLIVPITMAFDTTQITSPANYSSPPPGGPCHPLAAGAHAPAVAFTTKLHNTQSNQAGKVYEEYATSIDASSPPPAVFAPVSVALRGRAGGATAELGDEVQNCLRASQGGGDKPHVLAPVAVPDVAGTMKSCKDSGGWGNSADHAAAGYMLPVSAAHAVRAVTQTITSNYGKQVDSSDTALGPNVVMTPMQVRRLTPVECERLQGFPGNWTAIPWRGKPAAQCPDGPRYKALGNSWAVPVVRWIGRRIAAQMECVL